MTPADADTDYIEYTADHTQLTLGVDILSVPDRQINLVYLYIRWCAIQELSAGVKRIAYMPLAALAVAHFSSPTPKLILCEQCRLMMLL